MGKEEVGIDIAAEYVSGEKCEKMIGWGGLPPTSHHLSFPVYLTTTMSYTSPMLTITVTYDHSTFLFSSFVLWSSNVFLSHLRKPPNPHHRHSGEVHVMVCLYGCFGRNCIEGDSICLSHLLRAYHSANIPIGRQPKSPHIQDRTSDLHVHIHGERV